jgi:hypothetical protein
MGSLRFLGVLRHYGRVLGRVWEGLLTLAFFTIVDLRTIWAVDG